HSPPHRHPLPPPRSSDLPTRGGRRRDARDLPLRSAWMRSAPQPFDLGPAGGTRADHRQRTFGAEPGRHLFALTDMSELFERLKHLFDEGHGVELPGLRNDASFAPPVVRPAAVLIAVTDRSEPGVILTHRPADMRAHPGQVAFPGGKLDPGEDAVEAALREAHEELAIARSDVRVIGASDRFITGTGYDVTPV